MNPHLPPKGSLEELFRHHLLESEAAAVPPRPLVWDQLDNSLLLAQNEKYRRRLLVHRWGMAASLLLAALAGGGWWHSQHPASTTLANASTHAARQAAVAQATGLGQQGRSADQPLAAANGPAAAYASRTALASVANEQLGTSASAAATKQRAGRAAHATAATSPEGSYPLPVATEQTRHPAAPLTASTSAATSPTGFSYSSNAQLIGSTSTSSSLAVATTAKAHAGHQRRAGGLASSPDAAQPLLPTATAATLPAAAISPLGEASLSGRPVALALGPAAGLPASLPPVEVPPLPTTKLQHWRVGVQYTASAFQPNIDFGTTAVVAAASYNSLAANSFSLGTTQAAAAEYRANLQPGLGQRLGLRVTRWLGGHWALSTGVEAAQQEAYSATSVGFVGEPIATMASNFRHDLRRSTYRYRSAGIPVELRYENPVKTGVSLYGRLGAIVSALLNVRIEVADNSEVTRTYSPFATTTPYRRLTTLLRGGAGVRYRPAHGAWSLNVGPSVELGTQSMNTETDKSFLQQKRPYSFGVEAGLEFGGGLVPMQ